MKKVSKCKQNARAKSGQISMNNTDHEIVVEVGIERLRSFKDHPFKVKDDDDMAYLKDSISRYGIMNPLIVTPNKEGYYTIVSGHRRKHCAEQLGYTKVPVIIRVLSEDDSIISMIDSNLQRDRISYSEKAFALHMKNEAMKRKAGRQKHTQAGELASLKGEKTIHLVGESVGESSRQVSRFIRLTKLIPELLEMLDEGKISFNPAVEITFLKEEEQKWLLEAMDYTMCAPSLSQANRIRMLSEEGKLNLEIMKTILGEIKKGDMSRVIFKNSQMYKYFPKEYSPDQIKNEILKLLDEKYGENGGEKNV